MIAAKMLIDGAWVDGRGARIEVINPARGEAIGTVPVATPEDIDAALRAAKSALPGWAGLPPADRAAILKRIAAVIADTTATPSAPAPIARGARSAVNPPMATTGSATRRRSRPNPSGPMGGDGLSLLAVGHRWPIPA